MDCVTVKVVPIHIGLDEEGVLQLFCPTVWDGVAPVIVPDVYVYCVFCMSYTKMTGVN